MLAQPISDLNDSQANAYIQELRQLKDSKESTKEQFVNLFNRWVIWLDGCDKNLDPRGYKASATSIFAVAHWAHNKKLITDDEKRDLEQRAVPVIKDPSKDLLDFLAKYK